MDFNSIFYSVGITGFFTSRAFLPAFLSAVAMRYGADIPLLSNIDMLQAVNTDGALLTNDYVMIALGLLSVLEISGDKIPESQELLNQFGTYLKPAMAALTSSISSSCISSFVASTVTPKSFNSQMRVSISCGFRPKRSRKRTTTLSLRSGCWAMYSLT